MVTLAIESAVPGRPRLPRAEELLGGPTTMPPGATGECASEGCGPFTEVGEEGEMIGAEVRRGDACWREGDGLEPGG